jgi:hypothetical protein
VAVNYIGTLHPVAEVKVDVFMQDENLRQASESEFYKRSDSNDKQTTSTLESQDGASSDLLLEVFTLSFSANSPMTSSV